MRYTHVYALLLAAAFCASCGQKQNESHKDHFNYAIKDTITPYGPRTMVRNVKQGRNSTILIAASRGGVFRYDGKSFTNIASKIGSRRYWDVLEDSRGNVWMTTTDSGVYRFNGKFFKHFTTREGLASNTVMRVYEDRAGIIWFGTGDGISRFDGKSFKNLTTKAGHQNNAINTIIEDKAGKLWIGTRGETFVYDGKTFTTLKNNNGEAFTNVWSIIEDRKGNIWFGGSIIKDRKGSTLFLESGLWRYDGKAISKVAKSGATAIIEDRKGNIWTTGNLNPPNGRAWALLRYDQKTLYETKPVVTEIKSITGTGMLCGILEANDGSIWFGALGPQSGVYRYDGKATQDFQPKE